MSPNGKVALTFPVVLFLTPPDVPVTLTMTVHDVLGGRIVPTVGTSVLPGFANTKAPSLRQVPPKPLGDATTKPLGSGSSTETLLKLVLAFGLPKVSVSVVVPLNRMLLAPKALAIVGGLTVGAAVTVSVAVLLAAPAPLSLAEMGPVVLLLVPVLVACTSTEIKHEPLEVGCLGTSDLGTSDLGARGFDLGLNGTAGPRSPPARVMVDEPGVAVTVPSQLLLRLLGLATTTPGGKLSVNAIAVRVTSEFGNDELLLGLLMVKLNSVVAPFGMLSGMKSLLMVGGKATPKVADAVPPVPPSLEPTAPVVFR